MKISKQAKEFLASLGKGDKQLRKFMLSGGRKGIKKDFNKILTRASKVI